MPAAGAELFCLVVDSRFAFVIFTIQKPNLRISRFCVSNAKALTVRGPIILIGHSSHLPRKVICWTRRSYGNKLGDSKDDVSKGPHFGKEGNPGFPYSANGKVSLQVSGAGALRGWFKKGAPVFLLFVILILRSFSDRTWKRIYLLLFPTSSIP